MDFTLILIYISIYVGLISTVFYMLGFNADKKEKKLLFRDSELPKVSILIPAFNEEKSLAKTVESAFSSTYPKKLLEIIVIDNNSKDNTYKIAKSLQKKYKKLKVFKEKKQGKGHALNLGIKKSNGEFFFSMDADTFIEPHCVKEMIRYFKNKKVMSVTPSMLIHKPKGILQRVQQAEYLFGLFIRKAFASVNAIHVTPGAFSAYRKSFINKYGGYDADNITEDLELSLRIQYNGGIIEYCPEAAVYTIAPKKFKDLLIQRRRWYTGLMKNTWNYKKILTPKYGDLGIFVFPMAWISIFFTVFLINYMVVDFVINLRENFLFLSRANFDFSSMINLNSYVFERSLFQLISNPVIIFFLFFVIVITIYVIYATKKTGKVTGLPLTIGLYFIFFAPLFGIWWTISIIYIALNKTVSWR